MRILCRTGGNPWSIILLPAKRISCIICPSAIPKMCIRDRTYRVADSAGNIAEKTIQVTVVETPTETTLTSDQGIKITGLFTSGESLTVSDVTANHSNFDQQEIVQVWQLKVCLLYTSRCV